MGTRGALGFHKNGEDKVTYNHFDSYPSHLGKHVLEFIKNVSVEDMERAYDRIELVDWDSEPTEAQVVECMKFLELGVSGQSPKDWYCLLRNAQGNLYVYLSELRYMFDNRHFLKDSLFCEWGYVINLDKKVLEVYRGFQKEPSKNRYSVEKPISSGYYNCRLIDEIPLEEIQKKSFDIEDRVERWSSSKSDKFSDIEVTLDD